MRGKLFIVFAFVWAAFSAGQMVQAGQTIAYPTVDEAAFLIEAPDEWEFAAAEEEGDYFTLTGPSGAMLYFRTVEADEDSIDEAIQETVDYVEGEYEEVDIASAEEDEHNGMSGFAAAGTGSDEEGNEYIFAFGWYLLENGQLIEIWFECAADDEDGINEAKAIVNSLANP